MEFPEHIEQALSKAWDMQTAKASFERWMDLCAKENWHDIPQDIESLISIFGASWYFTRYIFYRGRDAAEKIDGETRDFDLTSLQASLDEALVKGDEEEQFEELRRIKNEIFLQLLVHRLKYPGSQTENEAFITNLAIATLVTALKILGLNPEDSDCRLAVLGMGRMAGGEMSFGSDLDLIFLFENVSDDFRTYLSDKVRRLLRHMSYASPNGMLYEIDMRLRPHGTSGALITSVDSFRDYHLTKRECWERQMMTRCAAIVDGNGIGQENLSIINEQLYAEYDKQWLRMEIHGMRLRVEEELGKTRGKIDIKRGTGGIMDIDFLMHYFQLKEGHKYPELRIKSTRKAIHLASESGCLEQKEGELLLEDYNYFKRIEACLRLFDMKSISSFSATPEKDSALLRALDYKGENAEAAFIDDVIARRERTRGTFLKYTNLE